MAYSGDCVVSIEAGVCTMTTTLQTAFEKAAALPPEQQESLAAILLEEIAVEDRWRKSFAQFQDALAKLAAEALDEDAHGPAS
jgi:hypothetical protein